MFTGAMVALITPFQDGQVDFKTLEELVEFQIKNGIDAIVPVGTTGECPTLSHDEHKQVIERVVKTVSRRVLVIAGARLQLHRRSNRACRFFEKSRR